ncbi:hypothetical protein [Halovivax gelatinilyticus]|uniref:hypothetical protein n=1 Tax=Halovivax gelatinilyticus TaxID=2961597 RepID=UPI0020CA5B5C|nr:hypothetical protein [Halovivax gelatinilyticus]
MRKRRSAIRRDIDALKRTRRSADAAATDAPAVVTVEWREADPVARPTGTSYDAESATLTYDLWGPQQACLEALESEEVDIVANLGGYASGKTIFGARWTIAQALAHPGSRFLAMGMTFSEARNTTFRNLCEQLPGDRTELLTRSFNGPEQSPIVADFNRSEYRLTLTNDTTIILGSADTWNRYAGDAFGGIWLDEPSHYQTDLHDLLEMVGSRLRGVDGPKVQCWTLTGNGYNDAWEILEQRQDSTGNPIGLEIELIRSSTLENPYLDAGTVERFKRQYDGTERETQTLHGGFAEAEGLVYSDFRRDTHVIPHADARDRVADDWRAYGYDAGWNDPRVLVEVGKTPYDQLVVLDEFYESECHLDDAIEWLDSRPRGIIYGDHAPDDLDRFRRAGYDATAATRNLDAGIAEVRRRLESDGRRPIRTTPSVVTFVGSPRQIEAQQAEYRRTRAKEAQAQAAAREAAPEGAVGLLVSDRCERLVREFHGYKGEHVGKSGAQDHALDALRYVCMGVAGR